MLQHENKQQGKATREADLVAHEVAGRVGLVQQGPPLIVNPSQDGDDAQRPHVRVLQATVVRTQHLELGWFGAGRQ